MTDTRLRAAVHQNQIATMARATLHDGSLQFQHAIAHRCAKLFLATLSCLRYNAEEVYESHVCRTRCKARMPLLP